MFIGGTEVICTECQEFINQDNYAGDGICINCRLALSEEELMEKYGIEDIELDEEDFDEDLY